jgi:transposase
VQDLAWFLSGGAISSGTSSAKTMPIDGVKCTEMILIKASSHCDKMGWKKKLTISKGGSLMRFYSNQHQFYCGIDLHARAMYVCIIDQAGKTLVHKNIHTDAETFTQLITPYQNDIVVAVECIFTWYWIADLCHDIGIHFVLGHALYMKAIHGGKTKNDKIDSHKIATLLRGGMLPMAYVYPQSMRSTRDLLRRRMHLMHHRSEILAHIQNTNSQYNLEAFGKKIAYKANRENIVEHFPDPFVRKSIDVDSQLLDTYDALIRKMENEVLRMAKKHDPLAFHLLRTVPGIGPVLALVILYEIHDITRFPAVGNFISYCRLVKCQHESAGKKTGSRNNKIGNVHLKWAFSEAACLFLRNNMPAQKYHEKLVSKYGKAKALSIIAQKIGRTVYFMLKRNVPYDEKRFFEKQK